MRLDPADALRAADPGGALDAVASFADQVRAGADVASGVTIDDLPSGEAVRAVVFCGMGGSAVGGDVLAAVASASGTVPVVVHRGYGVPAWCGPGTLVVCSSYSGSTEETLDAFRAARAAGARGVAVTTGGPLGEEAEAAGWVVAPVDAGLMPRYAVGWMSVVPAAVCARLGVVRLSPGWADALVASLAERTKRWGPEALVEENPAKGLALALVGAFPVVWGGGPASTVAAVRWKNDLNENAKVFAHAAALPEGDHNEIVGWAREGRTGRPGGRRVLICLREPDEDARVAARFEVTTREVADDFDLVWETTARGDDVLQRFCDLALLGEYVSCYLALARGVDPTPVDSIARLKDALARR